MEGRCGHVVVVDDDPGMRGSMEQLLVAAGFDVSAYVSAEDLLRTPPPEVACLILDVHLPRLSGFELLERIRSGGSAPPVVFVTAHDDAGTRSRAEALGAFAYLAKPFPRGRLLELVARATSESSPCRRA